MLTVLILSLFHVSFRSFHQCPKQSWWHWVGITIASRTSECFTYSYLFFTSSCINQDSRVYAMWRIRPPNLTRLSQYNLPHPSCRFQHRRNCAEPVALTRRSAGIEIDCCSVTSQLPQMSKPSRLGGAGDSSWTRGSEQQRCICFGSKVCKAVSASSVVISFLSGLLRPWVELTDSKTFRCFQAAELLQHSLMSD